MNWKQKAQDARELADALGETPEVPFEELAGMGVVFVTMGINPGPTAKGLVQLALYERAEVYEALETLSLGKGHS